MDQKKNLLVTGCSGRIGGLVAERLCSEFRIIGLDIVEPMAKKDVEIDYFPIDLSSDTSVQHCFQTIREKIGQEIAAAVHLAAYYSFSGERPELYDKITVHGTERLLKALKEFQTGQLIFSSTDLVYAPSRKKIHEDSKVEPKWDYPRSKMKTEKILRAGHGSIPLLILRIAGCYDDKCHSIPLANQIQRIYEHEWISHLFSGNISHGSAFVHLDDVVDAIVLGVQKRNTLPPDLILNIGEAETMSYDDLQREIASLIDGKPFTTYRIPKPLAKLAAWIMDHTPGFEGFFIKPWMIDIADDNMILDISKAISMLGWQPKHTLRKTIPKMIQFLLNDPIAFYRENALKVPLWMEKKYSKEQTS